MFKWQIDVIWNIFCSSYLLKVIELLILKQISIFLYHFLWFLFLFCLLLPEIFLTYKMYMKKHEIKSINLLLCAFTPVIGFYC